MVVRRKFIKERVLIFEVLVEERIKSFVEVNFGYDFVLVVKEVERCF